MTTIHIQTTVQHDGEVHLSNLPLKRGQVVALSIQLASDLPDSPLLTAHDLATSELVGLWEDRTDVGDSLSFARHLRTQGQQRER